jgi:hypothetical protein
MLSSGRIRRIYADTSIFGGLFEVEFQHGSESLIELVKAGQIQLCLSDIVLKELLPAPPQVRQAVSQVMPFATALSITAAARKLQEDYIVHEVLGRRNEVDALHVALATVSQCNAIVSWNFRHIVNDRRIPLFNAVNALRGYNQIGIFTPHAVIGNVDN